MKLYVKRCGILEDHTVIDTDTQQLQGELGGGPELGRAPFIGIADEGDLLGKQDLIPLGMPRKIFIDLAVRKQESLLRQRSIQARLQQQFKIGAIGSVDLAVVYTVFLKYKTGRGLCKKPDGE